ncbi:MAG: hypothetical protein AMXMBFR7_52300 [Planctomycetota bacterium]
MRLLGRVVRLQVQRERLKRGERPARRYDPEPLLDVAELELSENGVWGWTAAGERHTDVHNRLHESHNYRGENGISFGFTGHYAAMRTRFGSRLVDGIAGENILIESADVHDLQEFANGLRIVTEGDAPVDLSRICVAEPCLEFTRFALDQESHAIPAQSVAVALQFLRRGLRGFYATWEGLPVRIRLGAQVFASGPRS